MDKEQIDSLVSQLKGVGLDDEQILDVFYEAFKKGKMDRKDLETLADSLGYELDDDFKNEATPDPIEGEAKSEEPASPEEPEITKDEAEDLKEIKPGESKEEFEEKIDEAKDEMESDKDDHEEKEEEDEDEDEEEKETLNKYFKI